MLNAIAVGGAIVSLLASPLSTSPEAPEAQPMARVVVEAVTVNGSGCPTGSAATSYSPSTGALTVSYGGYYAWRGEDSETTDFRRNCQLGLQVKAPAGWTYTLGAAEYRGFAYLEGATTAAQAASYYFQGVSKTVTLKHAFVGPFKEYWRTTDTAADLEDLGFAPCGTQRNLNINTELRVTPGAATAEVNSFISMESMMVYRIALKRCA